MQLALNLGYYTGNSGPDVQLRLAMAAEQLGYSSVWVAEAYGSDAVTALTWLAARTSTIELGSAVLQIPARTPALTAMTAATLDLVSGGRLRLGLGVSGPQVSEGWHGVRFDRPLARTREYLEVVRLALARERVVHAGEHFPLPLPDGPGKALQLMLQPVRQRVPIYLGAVGPRNLELTGELADGWLATFFSRELAAEQLAQLAAGRRRAGLGLAGFDVLPTVPVSVGADVAACADPVRAYAALYVGGMGSRKQNFYNQLAIRMGYPKAAMQVQDLYLAGHKRAAAEALPVQFLDQVSLLGPADRIAEQLQAYAAAGVTTLGIALTGKDIEHRLSALRTVAEALDRSGVGS
jgi:F420-dependent oxidoreductase-like protein